MHYERIPGVDVDWQEVARERSAMRTAGLCKLRPSHVECILCSRYLSYFLPTHLTPLPLLRTIRTTTTRMTQVCCCLPISGAMTKRRDLASWPFQNRFISRYSIPCERAGSGKRNAAKKKGQRSTERRDTTVSHPQLVPRNLPDRRHKLTVAAVTASSHVSPSESLPRMISIYRSSPGSGQQRGTHQ